MNDVMLMSQSDARAAAISMLRRRLETGWWSRQRIEQTIFEGSSGPGVPGYLITGGRLSIPSPRGAKHEGEGIHTFILRALLDEIESPQAGLFG